MKRGDLVKDAMGNSWIIVGIEPTYDTLYLANLKNHLEMVFMPKADIIHHEPKPANIEWLFLARREKELKGLKVYR